MHRLTRTQKTSRHRKVAETETRVCELEQRRGFGNYTAIGTQFCHQNLCILNSCIQNIWKDPAVRTASRHVTSTAVVKAKWVISYT